MAPSRQEIEKVLKNADKEVQVVLSEVYRIEKEKLYMSLPHKVVEEIVDVIRRVVK